MNHGYCKNCWWWEVIPTLCIEMNGKCHMHNGDTEPYTITKENSYCPDYTNRKKEEKKSGTLEDWIKEQQV